MNNFGVWKIVATQATSNPTRHVSQSVIIRKRLLWMNDFWEQKSRDLVDNKWFDDRQATNSR